MARYGAAAVIGYATLIGAGAGRPEAYEYVDQSASPLGRRRHCACARRLMQAGDARASKVGRRFLIRSDALETELSSIGGSRLTTKPADPSGKLAESLGFELEKK